MSPPGRRRRADGAAGLLLLASAAAGAAGEPRLRRAAAEATSPHVANVTAARMLAEHAVREQVLRRVGPGEAKVHVWHDAAISCKGQVFKDGAKALVGCSKLGCGVPWSGCGFSDGTCVWDSHVGHVSRKPYRVKGGFSVPHAPGPGEKSPERCREFPETCWLKDTTMRGGPVDTVVVLTQPQWGAYYHFVIDALSRVFWVYRQYPEVMKDERTLFHTGMVDASGQAWARLVGIDTEEGENNRLLDGWWFAKTIYFPPSNDCANNRRGAHVEVIEDMHKKVSVTLPKLTQLAPVRRPVMLVVRRDPRKSTSRAVLNHDELVEKARKILKGWHFEVFSDYPNVPDIVTTCRMFFQADMIMGPHGAGFANLVCARPGTALIEFQQTPHSWDYELLSMKLSMPYVGVPTTIQHMSPGTVDVDLVVDAIRTLLPGVKKKAPDPPSTGSAPGSGGRGGGAEKKAREHANKDIKKDVVKEINKELKVPKVSKVIAAKSKDGEKNSDEDEGVAKKAGKSSNIAKVSGVKPRGQEQEVDKKERVVKANDTVSMILKVSGVKPKSLKKKQLHQDEGVVKTTDTASKTPTVSGAKPTTWKKESHEDEADDEDAMAGSALEPVPTTPPPATTTEAPTTTTQAPATPAPTPAPDEGTMARAVEAAGPTAESLVVSALIPAQQALQGLSPEEAKVQVWEDVAVSCKGQVFRGTEALVGCARNKCGASFGGCLFGGGTCVWDSQVSGVSKKPYCVGGGLCVPHGPGPAEASTLACREDPEMCQEEPGFVGGPVEKIVVLTQPQWGAYYHFVIDSLSRLHWIRKEYPELLEDDTTRFHTGMVSATGQAWAQMVGIKTDVGEANRLLDGWWSAKTVYFPPWNGCANEKRGTQLDAIRGMREQVLQSLQLPLAAAEGAAEAAKVALVVRRDRRKSQARSVRNHDEVVAEVGKALPGWKVEVFSDFPETPPVREICRMFNRASLILGPHGAGFSHLVCARPGTPLIEFQKDIQSWDYELLAIKLSLPYVGVKTNMQHYSEGDVNLAALRLAIQRALGPHEASSEDAPEPAPAASAAGEPEGQATPAPAAAATAPTDAPTDAPAAADAASGGGLFEVLERSASSTEALSGKEGALAEVQLWKDVLISCKGQVFQGSRALVGCGAGGCGMDWEGCGFTGGTCVWDSGSFRGSHEEYCLVGGLCVPHAPGPAEQSPEDCREHTETETECMADASVVGGPLDVVVVLTQPEWGSYYHFVVSSLSRVVWVQEQFPAVARDKGTYFHTGLVTEQAQAWARLVGIDTARGQQNRLLDGWWRAKAAYFPPANGCVEMKRGADPHVVAAMRTAIAASLSRAPGGAAPQEGAAAAAPLALVLLGDRERATIEQEDLVARSRDVLAGWSVQEVTTLPADNLDVLATCHAVRRAKLIIVVPGAGCANLLCAQKGTPVVEFQGRYHKLDVELLTIKLELPYFGARPKEDLSEGARSALDAGSLREVLSKAIPDLPAPTTAPPATTSASRAATPLTSTARPRKSGGSRRPKPRPTAGYATPAAAPIAGGPIDAGALALGAAGPLLAGVCLWLARSCGCCGGGGADRAAARGPASSPVAVAVSSPQVVGTSRKYVDVE